MQGIFDDLGCAAESVAERHAVTAIPVFVSESAFHFATATGPLDLY